jgi:hypothetical protein
VIRLLGAAGLVCLLVAAVGLAWSSGLIPMLDRPTTETPSPPPPPVPLASYYPLEVGRYWVYVSRDSATGATTEVERRIVRRENGQDRDLYFFADGGMAFRRDGMVCEIGPEGGLNVVPLDTLVATTQPYPYVSRGLHIEKVVAARDTAVVVEGHRYPACVQVITRFRRVEDSESAAYASYYARGIGLVCREPWPREGGAGLAVTLKTYGPGAL